MTTMPAFRFDPTDHSYVLVSTGEIRPHVTGMLARCGYDYTWCSDAGRERGRAVHRLAADIDLGALDITDVDIGSEYRPYLNAYVAAIAHLRQHEALDIQAIEQAMMHPTWLYGTTIDRVVTLRGRQGVIEIKTGAEEAAHPIQTALQCEILACQTGIPAWGLGRWALYLRPTGRYRVIEHPQRADFDEAHRIIKECCC